jgi:hypothetical protein
MKKLFNDFQSQEHEKNPVAILHEHLREVASSIHNLDIFVEAIQVSRQQKVAAGAQYVSKDFFTNPASEFAAKKRSEMSDYTTAQSVEVAPVIPTNQEVGKNILAEEITLDPLQFAALQADQKAAEVEAPVQRTFPVSPEDELEAKRQARIIAARQQIEAAGPSESYVDLQAA